MKKYFYFATALVALAACSSNDLVDGAAQIANESNGDAIVFSSSANSVTRADHVGADAAGLLNKKFVVGGFKGALGTSTAFNASGTITTEGVPATTVVYDNYITKWTENTAATTESNTSDWEYVGLTALAPSTLAGNIQSIKYWDYTAAQYDFIAYSTSDATVITTGTPSGTQVLVSAISAANAGKSASGAYTLKGDAAGLAKCYIADMVTAYKDGSDANHKYQAEVPFVFRALASKVRVALYETVPGYSVKDVKFYANSTTTLATGASATDATLFTTGGSTKDNFYTSGEYKVYFPTIGKSNISNSDYNKAHVVFTPESEGKATTQSYGGLNYVAKEDKEKTGTQFLGRTSTAASFAGTSPYYKTVLPNEEGTVLELRVDYTLESIDGSGEEIKIHGATAFVPAIYAAWKPNYAYTYIFKISDNTNGWTSTVDTDPAGLYPITFDAVVSETTEHTQSTITNVATPSITTYQVGHVYTDEEYDASKGAIYIQVMNGGTLASDLATRGQRYMLSRAATEAEVMDALNIQASSTSNTITGRNGLTLTTASSDATITTIPGADGNNITVTAGTAASFNPAAGKYYAYVYYTGTDNADTEYTTAVNLTAEPTGWPTGYYTDEACTVAASTYANGTYYQKYTNLNKVYGVKVIKIKS